VSFDSDIWDTLDPSTLRTDELAAKRTNAVELPEFFCGVGKSRERHFLIQTSPSETKFADDKSRGLTVNLRELVVLNEVSGWYIDIRCVDEKAFDLFDLFGADLSKNLKLRRSEPAAIVAQCLANWRRFWSEPPRAVLTDDELAGLFGELWFLHIWLAPAVGYRTAVESWRGPFGSRQDFQSVGLSIEVKTTRAQAGRRHLISGIDQLAITGSAPLLFFSLKVQQEASATNTLPTLVDLVRERIREDAELASQFESALVLANYDDRFRAIYDEKPFRVVDGLLFEVDTAFPSLTISSLKDGQLVPGVISVDYQIELSGHLASALATTAESANKMLVQIKGAAS
jgi:hypothetical protein